MAMARVVAASVAMERPLRLSVVMTALYFKTPQSSLVAPGFKLSQRQSSWLEPTLISKLSHAIDPMWHIHLASRSTSPSKLSPSSAM